MMFSEIKMEHYRCRWCNYKLNCTNNVFRIKQKRDKLPPHIFRRFELRRKLKLMF